MTLLACFVLGFFNSYAYQMALGLDASWMHETPLSWLRWGLKSIVAPLTLIVAVSLPSWWSAKSSRSFEEFRAPPTRSSAACGPRSPGWCAPDRLDALVGARLADCGAVSVFDWWVEFWRHPGLLNATLTAVDDASVGALSQLAPTNYDNHTAYRQVLSIGVLGMLFGWSRVASCGAPRRARGTAPDGRRDRDRCLYCHPARRAVSHPLAQRRRKSALRRECVLR